MTSATAWLPPISAVSAASFAGSRPMAWIVWPVAASLRERAAPMPPVAPMMMVVMVGYTAGWE